MIRIRFDRSVAAIVALLFCLLLRSAVEVRAQIPYEISSSTAPPAASQTIKPSDSKNQWIWWTIGIAIVAGIVIAIASSSKRGSGGGGGGGGGGY